jgi:hypothetical protein
MHVLAQLYTPLAAPSEAAGGAARFRSWFRIAQAHWAAVTTARPAALLFATVACLSRLPYWAKACGLRLAALNPQFDPWQPYCNNLDTATVVTF